MTAHTQISYVIKNFAPQEICELVPLTEQVASSIPGSFGYNIISYLMFI